MIVVKMANNKASKARNSSNMTVAGGLKVEHSFHSECTHDMNCNMTSTNECTESKAM